MAEEKQGLQGTLQKLLKEVKDDKGKDLYSHLQKVLVHAALTDPTTALDKFEEISYEIRTKEKFDPPERFLDYRSLALAAQPWAQALRDQYFEVKKPEGGDAPAEPAEPAPLGYVPDLLSDNRALEWAGLGFGEEESYLLMKSLKRLAQKQEPKTVRLWGKVYGINKDYYVAEGEKEAAGGEVPADVEARGTGVNKYVYWVTDSVTGEWVELPDATPNTIMLARQLKRMFTGNVDAEVVTNPHFVGKEKELLRAQIARITQTTTVIPKGFFKKQEDNEREITEVPEEEKKMPTFEQLTHLDNWCHLVPNVLNCGRTTHLQPEPPKEEPPGYDPAVALKEVETKDPYEPRLKPLSQDADCGDWKSSWTIKIVGDPQTYKEEFKDTSFTNAIIVLKSLVWPGAYILYQDNRWFNFYVGYGHKADQKDYYPVMPPLPQFEPVETLEQPEPNPKDVLNEEGKITDPAALKDILNTLEETIANPEKFTELLNKTFDAIDADNSGQIDKNEADKFLKDFIKEVGVPIEPDPKAVDEFFRLFDKDRSGTISKDEMMEPLKSLLSVWSVMLKQDLPESP